MNQTASGVYANMTLHAKAPHVAFSGLVHLRIACLLRLFRSHRQHRGRLSNSVYRLEKQLVQAVCFQQMTEFAQRCFVRHGFFHEINARKFPHRVAVIDCVFSGRIGEIKQDLKQVHPQRFLDAHRRTAAFSLGIIRLDYTNPFILRKNFIHDFKKFFPSRLLFAATVLNIGKCLLLHFDPPPIFDGFIISYSRRSFIGSIKSEVP